MCISKGIDLFAPMRKISSVIYLSQQSVFPWHVHRERVEQKVSFFPFLHVCDAGWC